MIKAIIRHNKYGIDAIKTVNPLDSVAEKSNGLFLRIKKAPAMMATVK